ncbi:MAG: Nif3-like dinuclear metal center hexameric protein [Salinirussus sp.]
MDRATLCHRLDGLLDTAAYADVDPSPNGLQVGTAEADREDHEVERVAVAVDAAAETIGRAIEADADLLVTHHGLIWDSLERLTGRDYRRVAPLVAHDVGLYVSHLPLDGHQELGNAASVADLLDLRDRAPFGTMGGEAIGQRGRVAEPVGAGRLRDRLEDALDTGGRPVRVLEFGPETVEDVAVVTGSGVDFLDEAVAAGVDAFVTGEGKQQVYHEAREAGVHVVLAGHYATETFGVRALAERIDSWGPETTFVDCPTGL